MKRMTLLLLLILSVLLNTSAALAEKEQIFEYTRPDKSPDAGTADSSRNLEDSGPYETDGSDDEIYQDFLDYLKGYLFSEETEPAAPYDSFDCYLYKMKRNHWNVSNTGYVILDIDGDGRTELLFGDCIHGTLYDVFTVSGDQLTPADKEESKKYLTGTVEYISLTAEIRAEETPVPAASETPAPTVTPVSDEAGSSSGSEDISPQDAEGRSDDEIYQDFLDYLKGYLFGDETEPAAPYDSFDCYLYKMKRNHWNVSNTGYVILDIDGDGRTELLFGDCIHGTLYDVFTVSGDQLISADKEESKKYLTGTVEYISLAAEIRAEEIPVPTAAVTPSPTPTPVKPIEVGDIITFGHYEQDNNTANGPEPIEWRVAAKAVSSDGFPADENIVLLVSTKVLDAMAFNTGGTNSWDTSSLRKWLQSTFFNGAFSRAEQNVIRTVSHKAGSLDTFPDVDTVFVLSMDEIQRFLPYPADRQFAPTAYAVRQKVYRGENGLACWWTRTYYGKGIVYNIWSTGEMTYGANVTDKDGGVLPAVWINADEWKNLP